MFHSVKSISQPSTILIIPYWDRQCQGKKHLFQLFFQLFFLTNHFLALTPYTILDALETKRFRLFFIFFQNSANIFHYSQSSDFIVVLVIGMILQMVILIESGCQCFFVMCFPFFIFHHITHCDANDYEFFLNVGFVSH